MLRRGGLPYQDVWDIKPPVIHELAALLAIVSGGDPFVLFVLSIILTSTVFVIIIALISDLTYAWTADRYAAVAAGLLPVLFPEFVMFASRGLRPKLFVIAFGLLSLRFYSQEKPFLSGILAALSAGLWQFGVFFPLAICSHTVLFKRWQKLVQIVMAGFITTMIVVSPFLLTKTLGEMLQQVIIAPLLISERMALIQRFFKGGKLLLFTAPLVVIGAVSAFVSTLKNECPWWVGAGLLWFTIQIWVFDLDSTPDLFAGLVFVHSVSVYLFRSLKDPTEEASSSSFSLFWLSCGFIG